MLADVCELYEPLAHEKGLEFHQQIMPCKVVGDKDLLFQLFANLCDNAIKYTPKGGTISIATGLCNGHICVSVCDTGSGIPNDKKQQVFRRFFRLDSSRSTQGTGLGLSLVSAVVRMHKGEIELKDNTPNGLCVEVSFPM